MTESSILVGGKATGIRNNMELNKKIKEQLKPIIPDGDILVSRPQWITMCGKRHKRWTWNLHVHGKMRVLSSETPFVFLVKLNENEEIDAIYKLPEGYCRSRKMVSLYENKIKKLDNLKIAYRPGDQPVPNS